VKNEVARQSVAIIGGGPAGLMAAQMLIRGGAAVDLYDARPSMGRKFLLAGKGGLNLTHAEPLPAFLQRYGMRQRWIAPLLQDFDTEAVRAWARALGIETFVGSSGRVFPLGMKAAPLLRAWLHELRAQGVKFHPRYRWLGWNDDQSLRFEVSTGERTVVARQVVLALGGASWPQLGSDAAWVPVLQEKGVAIAPLQAANCGFDLPWGEHFRSRFAGQPVKSVSATIQDEAGVPILRKGELMITQSGVEGGAVYALSRWARDAITLRGHATLHLDLAPGKSLPRLAEELARPRGSRSWSSHLKRHAGMDGVKAGLLRELLPAEEFTNSALLASAIKALPLKLRSPRPLAEAISTAGGVRFETLDECLMIRALPGVFCAGEMLDWEAPTGGYLLHACLASGRTAGLGALALFERTC
jgi:uncharacterized flavoprotein (TIGR03862 family)